MGVFQRPGTNATEAAEQVKQTMERLKGAFPEGLEYRIEYNPTEFINESIAAVEETIYEAIALVVLVVFIFLQSWRAAIVPVAAIPVSLIATFAVMSAFGFSLNLLTLFGLILAIGIVVDDAIVVVENVERNITLGKTPREAAHVTMDEVGTAVVAIALVLCAVFVPTAFIPGISGIFYKQFALTIATATVLSAIVSLTLSPALCALLLRPHEHGKKRGLFARAGDMFNRNFDRGAHGYSRSVGWIVRHKAIFLVIYVVLLGGAGYMFNLVPRGFIPQADQGYAILVVQLPEGANLQRTDEVARRASEIARGVPGVKNAVTIAGFSGATFSAASNAATSFIIFDPFEKRTEHGASQRAPAILAEAQKRLFQIQEAFVLAILPPTVRGIGQGGGFKMYVQDRTNIGFPALEASVNELIAQGQRQRQDGRHLHDLQHARAAGLSRHRPRQGAAAQRADPVHLRGAADAARHGLRQRLHAARTHVPGERPGRRRIPGEVVRRLPVQGALHERRAGAARHADHRAQPDRPLHGRAREHLQFDRGAGEHRARRLDRPGDRGHGEAVQGDDAARRSVRVGRSRLSGEARRQHRDLRVRPRDPLRVPVPRRAV